MPLISIYYFIQISNQESSSSIYPGKILFSLIKKNTLYSLFYSLIMFRRRRTVSFHSYLLAVCVLSCVWLFVTAWIVARQAPLSMEFSRQEYQSELPCPPPGDLPNPGTEPSSPALKGGFLTAEPPEKPMLLLLSRFSRVRFCVTP